MRLKSDREEGFGFIVASNGEKLPAPTRWLMLEKTRDDNEDLQDGKSVTVSQFSRLMKISLGALRRLRLTLVL